MIIKDNTLYFSSGHRAYANCGIVGLGPDCKTVSYGYDGGIDWPPYDETQPNALTSADMHELADHMIRLWSSFREQLP